ncbi:hypothetical protein BREVNS_2074 [Brevinematales bacterium NS]|nr:hypothetical protein BREVNS_2074 [Brevinematales bacterium NS]
MVIVYITDMCSKATISFSTRYQDKELFVLSLFIGNMKRGIQSDMWNDMERQAREMNLTFFFANIIISWI